MFNAAVLGSTGQLGSALSTIRSSMVNLSFFNRSHYDFRDILGLERWLETMLVGNDVIINTLAYTNVEQAELNPSAAFLINVRCMEVLSQFCARHGIMLVSFSTDFIYDGRGDVPYLESNQENLNPLNVYGRTKLEGEQVIREYCPRHMIFRTSWLYGNRAGNFVQKIISKAKGVGSLSVVDDQVGAPTNVLHLAKLLIRALECACQGNFDSYLGTYHLCNEGYASRYEIAHLILESTGLINEPHVSVEPTQTASFASNVNRPLNSRLSLEKFSTTFGLKPASWEDALKEYIYEKTRNPS